MIHLHSQAHRTFISIGKSKFETGTKGLIMKNRVSFFIVLSIFFISCFAVLILVSYAQTEVPELATAQELIKKEFPNSKITWSKEIDAEFVNFKASPVSVAISTKKGEKQTLEYINFKEGISWQIDGEKYPYYYYYLVGTEEQKILVGEYLHESVFLTHVFNTEGKPEFELKTNAGVVASPNGKYYYTEHNLASSTSLRVFDESGKQLWLAGTPNSDWQVEPLSDSELIYHDYSACILYDALSGDTLWRISFKPYFKLIDTIAGIVVSKDGNYFVIHDPNGLISLNRRGEIMWTSEEFNPIRSATLTHDGKYLALYFGTPRKRGEDNFVLLDNLNNGEFKWSKCVDLGSRIPNYYVDVKIEGDIITMLSAMPEYYYLTGINTKTNIYCYQIDLISGKLLNQYTVDGVCETYETNSGKVNYLLIDKGDKKEIFRMEETQ